MSQIFLCPHCRKKYKTSGKTLGKRVKCKRCSKTFRALAENVPSIDPDHDTGEKSSIVIEEGERPMGGKVESSRRRTPSPTSKAPVGKNERRAHGENTSELRSLDELCETLRIKRPTAHDAAVRLEHTKKLLDDRTKDHWPSIKPFLAWSFDCKKEQGSLKLSLQEGLLTGVTLRVSWDQAASNTLKIALYMESMLEEATKGISTCMFGLLGFCGACRSVLESGRSEGGGKSLVLVLMLGVLMGGGMGYALAYIVTRPVRWFLVKKQHRHRCLVLANQLYDFVLPVIEKEWHVRRGN